MLLRCLITAILLVGLACIREGFSQSCYNTTDCTGSTVPAVSERECCVDTNDGYSYGADGSCKPCIVHGFVNAKYSVMEENRLDTMFRMNVKGATPLTGLTITGTITSRPAGIAESSDFTNLMPIMVINSANVRLFTANDEITQEYNDRVLLIFTPDRPAIFSFVERMGEYIRSRATVDIIDNDYAVVGLESTFYTATEGYFVQVCTIVYKPTGSCPIVFEFAVDFFTSDITAVTGADYVDSDTTLTFAACETRKCVIVPIVDDSVHEMIETLRVSLGIPSHNKISVSPPEGINEIIDNDSPPPPINGSLVNDTVRGSLMTVPIFTTPNISTLCFEVHGEANKYFNLISDNCVAVTAHYAPATNNSHNITLNVIDAVGVRAVSSNGTCVNIEIGLQGCSAEVDGVPVTMYRVNGVVVRRYSNRVRVTVPNCGETDLVVWIFCTSGRTEDPFTWEYFSFNFLRFVIMRGLNLAESSHGLLGQFWNVPVDVEEHVGNFNGVSRSDDYKIIVRYPGRPRSFVGLRTSVMWENENELCLYVGNSQAGPLGEEVEPNDSVIEGTYKDYLVASLFSPRFKFAHIDENNCMTM